MGASQFVLDNIIVVLGGAGTVVTGLSTYLGKRWADSALAQEKAVIEANLQNQKNSHALQIQILEKDLKLEMSKKDQFHQISKTTYEKIFETKIKIYSDLLNLKIEYLKHSNERYRPEDNLSDIFYPTFMKCREMLESNKLYISNELSDKYDLWYIKASPYLKAADINGYHVHGMAYTDEENWENIAAAESVEFSKMIDDTTNEMQEIFKQVDLDILSIRTKIQISN